MGVKVDVKVSLNLHIDENKQEFNLATGKLVRAATLKVQQLAVTNLYEGVYAQPEDPKRPRTGALANSVYSETGDGGINDKSYKVAQAQQLNPKAQVADAEYEPEGPFEGKVGVGVEYGVYMEAYMPFLEPAAKSVQDQIADLWENP